MDAHLHGDLLSPENRERLEGRLDGALIPGVTPDATTRALSAMPVMPAGWWWSAAWHPLHLPPALEEAAAWRALERVLDHPRVCAIGETGLDYRSFVDAEERARQRDAFERHLALAVQRGLPVVLHCVRAHAHALDAVQRSGARGMVHAFGGSAEEARRWLDAGWMLSFGPMLATASPKRAQAACRLCPWDRLLLETDAPFMVQPDADGTLDSSAALLKVAACVAALRGAEVDDVLRWNAANLARLLGQNPDTMFASRAS